MECDSEEAEMEQVEKKRIRLLRPQTQQPKQVDAKEERHANLRKVIVPALNQFPDKSRWMR